MYVMSSWSIITDVMWCGVCEAPCSTWSHAIALSRPWRTGVWISLQALLGHYRSFLPLTRLRCLEDAGPTGLECLHLFPQTLETVIHPDVDTPSWGRYELLTAGRSCSVCYCSNKTRVRRCYENRKLGLSRPAERLLVSQTRHSSVDLFVHSSGWKGMGMIRREPS